MIPITFTVTNKKVAPADQFQGIGLILDIGQTTIDVNTIRFVSPSERDSIFSSPSLESEIYRKLVSFFQNSSSNGVYVLNLGAPSNQGADESDWTQVFANLNAYLNTPKTLPYTVLCPNGFWGKTAFKTLIDDYDNPTAMLYFLIETTGVSFSSGTWTTYKGIKSLMGIFQPTGKTYSVAGAIHGILCSNKYATVSIVNNVTPLEYTQVTGVEQTEGTSDFINELNTQNIVYIGATAQENTISNAKLADGKQYTYYFNQDYALKKIADWVEVMIYNGSNSQPPLFYNQTGIDTFQQTVEGALDACNAVGTVNSYTVTCVDFQTYIKQFPDDYAAEAYNGCNAVIDGQKYILSVNIAVQYS